MKKLISLLLICAMMLTLAVTVAAESTAPASTTTEVAQSARMTTKQLLDGSNTDNYFVTTLTGQKYGSYDETEASDFKVAHDGDYLYIYTEMYILKGGRKNAEEFIYVDFEDDNMIDKTIVIRANYSPYTKPDNNNDAIKPYAPGCIDRTWTDPWGPETYVSVNQEPALNHGVIVGRNEAAASSSASAIGIYEIVIPMPEDVRTAIANTGSCEIGLGFTYLQNKTYDETNGANATYYSNCGVSYDLSSSTANNKTSEIIYSGVTESNLTTVTLKKGTTAQNTEFGIQYYQTPTTVGDSYAVRFLAPLNTASLAGEQIGFVVANNADLTGATYVDCTKAYTLVNAESDSGLSAYPAWYLGCDYITSITVTGFDKAATESTFYLGTYTTNESGEKVVADDDVYKVTVFYDETNGVTVTINPTMS